MWRLVWCQYSVPGCGWSLEKPSNYMVKIFIIMVIHWRQKREYWDSLFKQTYFFHFYFMCIAISSEYIAIFHLCDRHVERPDEGISSPRTKVIDSLSNHMGAANWTLVLWKRLQCSPLLTHIFSSSIETLEQWGLMDFLVAENITLLGRWFSLKKAGKVLESRLSITRHTLLYTVLPFSCSYVDPS